MKKVLSVSAMLLVGIIFLSSCGSSPFQKRKKCRGNGSWYGNRNLGAVEKPAQNMYVYRLEDSQLTASAE